MTTIMTPALSVSPVFFAAVSQIAQAMFGQRHQQEEIILEVRLDCVEAAA